MMKGHAFPSINGDRALHNTIRYNSTAIITNNAADLISAGNNAVGKDNVLYGTTINIAKETLIFVSSVDADTADGLAVTVEGTLKIF